MTTNQYRYPAEALAHADAAHENALAGNRGADKPNQAVGDSIAERSCETTRERGLYLPLLWAELARAVKPAKSRGKSKRQLRAAAVRVKRGDQGAIDLQLIGLIALAVVAGLLFAGGL
jgi:hypothetical protein